MPPTFAPPRLGQVARQNRSRLFWDGLLLAQELETYASLRSREDRQGGALIREAVETIRNLIDAAQTQTR